MSWIFDFFENFFLHPEGQAHASVARNVAKMPNLPLLSCVMDQVAWFKILNVPKNIVNWILIVVALQISCSWQQPLRFTVPRCYSRWCEIWVLATFVNGKTYQLRDCAIWEKKNFFLQNSFILQKAFANSQLLIWIHSLSKYLFC